MNDNDVLYLNLIKNPYKSKNITKKDSIDNLYNELKHKYNNINPDIYKLLLKKIEIFINDCIIKNILEEIIDKIDE